MVLVIILLLSLVFPQSSQAQIPLRYQLIQAYYPSSLATNFTPLPLSAPTVLGIATSTTGSFTIAILGDSMIDTLGAGIPALRKSLSRIYPHINFKILNYGYGASDIDFGLFRLNNGYDYQGSHHPSLISQKPDLVIVESFAYNNFGNSQSSIDRHWLSLGAITTTLRQNLPQAKILLAATITPNSIIFGNGVKDLHLSSVEKIEKTNTIKLYLQNLIHFATSQNFPLADAHHPSLRNDEGMKEYISSDGIHPSFAGATLFADTIASAISKYKIIDQ